jgi:hypothetical protein
MNIVYRKISELKHFVYNPHRRIEDIGDLVASMKRDGYWPWSPILITKNDVVIDGNRRMQSADSLEMVQIPTIVIESDKTDSELWAEYNTRRRSITSRDLAEAYYSGMDHLPLDSRSSDHIKAILKCGGKDLLKKIVESNISPAVVTEARATILYCSADSTNRVLKKVINWMVEKRMQRNCKVARRMGVSPSVIWAAITKNKELKIDITARWK